MQKIKRGLLLWPNQAHKKHEVSGKIRPGPLNFHAVQTLTVSLNSILAADYNDEPQNQFRLQFPTNLQITAGTSCDCEQFYLKQQQMQFKFLQ